MGKAGRNKRVRHRRAGKSIKQPGDLLVAAVVDPVLEAALNNDAFDPLASVDEIAAEVLPDTPPPPPGPPLPAGLDPLREK